MNPVGANSLIPLRRALRNALHMDNVLNGIQSARDRHFLVFEVCGGRLVIQLIKLLSLIFRQDELRAIFCNRSRKRADVGLVIVSTGRLL